MILLTATTDKDLQRLQALFSWDISRVEIVVKAGDGPGGNRGSANPVINGLRIELDPADVPITSEGKLLLADPRSLETVLHELFHLEQGRRGWLYRLKILWWRLCYEYADRPHEIEAREWARAQIGR